VKVASYNHDSVKVVVDDNGNAVSRMEYFPYGEIWIHEGEDNLAPKYNSQELDKETGYYFYNARHYDPEISRFVTPDVVIDGQFDTQGWNRYSYVKGNPIRYKDPTGHWKDKTETIKYDTYVDDIKSDPRSIDFNKGTVTKGDTLVKLAEKQLIKEKGTNRFSPRAVQDKVDLIKDINGLKSNTIKVGRKLTLGFSKDKIAGDAGADGNCIDNAMLVPVAGALVKGTQLAIKGGQLAFSVGRTAASIGSEVTGQLVASKTSVEFMLKLGATASALRTGANNKTLEYLSKLPPQIYETLMKSGPAINAAAKGIIKEETPGPSKLDDKFEFVGWGAKKIIDEAVK